MKIVISLDYYEERDMGDIEAIVCKNLLFIVGAS